MILKFDSRNVFSCSKVSCSVPFFVSSEQSGLRDGRFGDSNRRYWSPILGMFSLPGKFSKSCSQTRHLSCLLLSLCLSVYLDKIENTIGMKTLGRFQISARITYVWFCVKWTQGENTVNDQEKVSKSWLSRVVCCKSTPDNPSVVRLSIMYFSRLDFSHLWVRNTLTYSWTRVHWVQ